MTAPDSASIVRMLLRLFLALAVVSGIVFSVQERLLAQALPLLGRTLDVVDGSFRTVRLSLVSVGGEAMIEREITPARMHVLGEHVVSVDEQTRIVTRVAAGLLLQPLILASAILFGWPWRRNQELGLRIFVAAPLILLVLLLDVPLILYGFAWMQEVNLLDPQRYSPLIAWADFMNSGGRFALTLVASFLAIALAQRLTRWRA